MFTNWLTSPSLTSVTSAAASSTGLSSISAGIIAATPPDIILEVGPAPTARFVAHSVLLAMHSGYLRSAIRIDENGIPCSELPIFLTNVTPDQFSPLLTYMYTGYLDLNIENIFGVLLATHVLHMPRALEICRAFLSRTQSEGYFSSGGASFRSQISESNGMNNNDENPATNHISGNNNNGVKVIRPIPSKPTIPNLGFIVPPMPHISLPSTGTPFRSLLNNQPEMQQCNETLNQVNSPKIESKYGKNSPITSESVQKKTLSSSNVNSLSPVPEEDHREKFIGESSNLRKCNLENFSKNSKKLFKTKRANSNENPSKSLTNVVVPSKVLSSPRDNSMPTNGNASSMLSKKDSLSSTAVDNDNNKIIIDIASCDGPVRFRRVLNDAYGRYPQFSNSEEANNSVVSPPATPDGTTAISLSSSLQIQCQGRNHQSLSNSFHQQMAKNISNQQRQKQFQNEESENSSTDDPISGILASDGAKRLKYHHHHHTRRLHRSSAGLMRRAAGQQQQQQQHYAFNSSCSSSSSAAVKESSNELYSCVYCKHTFKSQYCYQKHAKRHLNPLSLSSKEMLNGDNRAGNGDSVNNASSAIVMPSSPSNGDSLVVKREVRPLDMNVQYYPCKTCGSKFPSYYFVHKHRKMCHANEENNNSNENS